MHQFTEAHLEKLKARIAAAHKRSEPGVHVQFSELINNNLIDADQSLLDARMTHSEGNHKKCSFHCQMTTLKLELALRHMEKGGGDSGLHLSGKAQEYISLLITGIVEFKTLIEWKNCNLRPAVKQWFVESVELYEDALNHLRFEKPKAAECAALGGLLLQDYICRAAEDEHFGQISIVGRCARIKLPADATALRSVTERLSKAKRTMMIRAGILDPKLTEQFMTAYGHAESALIDAIAAFADDNKKSLKKSVLALQSQIGRLDRLVAESQQLLEQREAFGDNCGEATVTRAAEQLELIVAPEPFEHEATLLNQVLKERVDDPQLLGLRILSISRTYRDLHKAYRASEYTRAEKLIAAARMDLEKLKLLLLQAQLFTSGHT